MEKVQTVSQDSILNNRVRSKIYADRNKLKNQVRRLARKYPLKDSCEFCGSTEKLERAHFTYRLDHPELFVTACKLCHEWIDRKHPDTQQLAYDKRQIKFQRLLDNYRCNGYEIIKVDDLYATYFRVIENEKIIEVIYPPI